MRIVVALGGNALLKRGEPMTAGHQRANVRVAAQALAGVATEHELVISHGNGPQVGLLALQGEAYKDVEAYPLDVLGAETQGMIGYLVEQELGNLLPFERPLATVLTMVEVDPDDPAFDDPTKFVGPSTTRPGEGLAADKGWASSRTASTGAASCPRPGRSGSSRSGRCAGCSSTGRRHLRRRRRHPDDVREGRGAPPRRCRGGHRQGPRDAACSRASSARTLYVMATDVDGVYADWGTPSSAGSSGRPPAELEAMAFAAGSMGPKVAAAIEFATLSGKRAAIGSLDQIEGSSPGLAGTSVVATTEDSH
jgi:carbamate kinase